MIHKKLINECECERCGHLWIPRKNINEIKHCPKCISPYWNKPRKIKILN